MRGLLKPEFMRKHPIQTGMLWAVGFVIVYLLVSSMTGADIDLVRFFVVAALAGVAFGYVMKWHHDRKARQQ
jgi:hypothetical protein